MRVLTPFVALACGLLLANPSSAQITRRQLVGIERRRVIAQANRYWHEPSVGL
jgi:hypothetical protein